jgi:hypothetical protein
MSREAYVQFCWSTHIIVCFEYEEDAKGFGERLRQKLEKFRLKVSEEKSRIIEFGRKTWQRAQEGGGKVFPLTFWDLPITVSRHGKGGKVGIRPTQRR